MSPQCLLWLSSLQKAMKCSPTCISCRRQIAEVSTLQAIERGAVAIVAAQEFEDPLEVPLILVPDADEALHRLGTSFYNDPSQKMTVIAIAGLQLCSCTRAIAQTEHPVSLIPLVKNFSKVARLFCLSTGRGSWRKYGVR